MEDLIARQKIEQLQDQFRDFKTKCITEDNPEYRRTVEKTHKNTEDVTELKTQLASVIKSLDKNNDLTETINLRNAKIDISLENINAILDRNAKQSENVTKDMQNDIKEMTEKVNRIDIDTSKNTDNRLTNKQLTVFVITTIIAACIGGILATPVP